MPLSREQMAARAREITDARVAELLDAADGDDKTLLALCGAEVEHIAQYQRRVLALRDETAKRLRERGEPMSYLARLANCTDSYLARRLLALGTPRRVVRGRRDG